MEFLVLVLFFFCLISPFVLTIINIVNLFIKNKIKPNLIDGMTFILGILLTCLLYWFCNFEDYYEPLVIMFTEIKFHAPIASWSMPTVFSICGVGIVTYILIRNKKLDLPPLMTVICMAGNLIYSIFCIVFIIQLSKNIKEGIHEGIFYFLIFPINYILCSIRAQIEILKYYKQKQEEQIEYDNSLLNQINKLLMKIDTETWPIIAIIIAIPLSVILIMILVLFGQRPDEIIRAFTETSDWTLSQKYSPPPIVQDGHYLCTVSLKGHKDIVKPLRYGIRRGEKIVVNRQLCIANAFEQLLEEKIPKVHHFIRCVYDKYGYPISKHINTPIQADVIYIIMKPLEWIFLLILYLFDKNPENRISIQYLPKREVL